MKSVTAREANHEFSALLARVEQGEEIVVTKHGRPVAVLSPFRPRALTPEREAAIARMEEMMDKGLPWGPVVRRFTRDEMHEE